MNDEQDKFIKATRILSSYNEPSVDNHTAVEQAIKHLRDAPPQKRWDRWLLQGLRCMDSELVSQTVTACVYRLHHFSDAEWQDSFMGIILDACFSNLSGRSRRHTSSEKNTGRAEKGRVNLHEQAAAKLIREIANHLRKHPLKMEHHRTRLLTRARQIVHLEGKGDLADAVADFQYALGEGAELSDNMVAAQLYLLRKLESYQSSKTTEPTLLAFLKQDKQLPLETIPQALFQNYRFLLNYHAKENAYKAILETMGNVIHWLDNIPWDGEGRDALVGDILKNVHIKKPTWDELTLPVRLHLEVQLELLPGTTHPEDLLNLLRTKYAANVKQSEDILIRGLELLQRCPMIRYRVDELCEFIDEPGKRQRSEKVWYAFLALVEKLLTGLADFRLVDQKVLGKEEAKRNKAMEQILAPDKKLQSLLRKISIDETWIAAGIRERAWRILLRSLPQERNDLYAEGLNGRFFIATLEEAAQQHQRSLWDLLISKWDQFVSVEIPAAERQARIKAIADYFRQTRVFEGVQNDGQIGPMLQLALDDQDSDVRQFAENAIISSGYALELQRERQRRELLRLSDERTETHHQVIKFDKALSDLNNQASEVQTKRADHALEIQALIQARELIVTQGWINSSHMQVDLGEVGEQLEQALREARKQLRSLTDLQQRMNEGLSESRQAYRQTDRLVSEQKNYEREQRKLEQQLSQAQSTLQQSQSEFSAAKRELNRLNNSYPSQPNSIPSDPDEARRVKQNYENAESEHRRRIYRQESTVNQLYRRINDCKHEINHCRNGIAQAENTLDRLQQEINQIRTRISDIERRIEGLRVEFKQGQATWKELHSKIDRLDRQTRAIKEKYAAERQSLQTKVNQNSDTYRNEQAALNQAESSLQQLYTQVNTTKEQLDYHETRHQELIQAIESGRQNYDEVGDQANQQSRQADATGFSLQAREEQKTQENQESRVFYAHGIKEELKTQPAPSTRQERKRPQHRPKSLQRSTTK
jgi:predicted  nucleic acid-binding Zn-ribbon protein